MNVKTVIPLALAIVLGLVAAFAAKNMIDRNKVAQQPQAHFTQVVIAKGDLPAGSLLHGEDLMVGRMAGDMTPESVFQNPADLEGRVLKVGLTKGAPIMEPLLAPKGTGSGMQALVPDGMRAVTIEINEFSGVGGFLVPGCHVDVMATVNGENNEMLARTVVQNVKVIAVNTHVQAGAAPGAEPEQLKHVTLIATPREAEAIALAAATGRPRLELRSSGDDALPESDGVTLAELRGKVRSDDPFDVKTVSSKSTTQPVAQPVQFGQSRSHAVKMIKGCMETEVNVPFAVRDSKWMTDSQQETQDSIQRD